MLPTMNLEKSGKDMSGQDKCLANVYLINSMARVDDMERGDMVCLRKNGKSGAVKRLIGKVVQGIFVALKRV